MSILLPLRLLLPGANDVANAFASSIAARTLTMRQALLIAAVCEFSGSVLLGGEVTRTVASGIAKLVSGRRRRKTGRCAR